MQRVPAQRIDQAEAHSAQAAQRVRIPLRNVGKIRAEVLRRIDMDAPNQSVVGGTHRERPAAEEPAGAPPTDAGTKANSDGRG